MERQFLLMRNCNARIVCITIHMRYWNHRTGKPRDSNESKLHILHSAGVRAGHSSFSRSVGKKYGGSEANGRTGGPESGHKFYTFLHGGGYGCGAARFVRYADRGEPRAGHLLTRECLVPFSRP